MTIRFVDESKRESASLESKPLLRTRRMAAFLVVQMIHRRSYVTALVIANRIKRTELREQNYEQDCQIVRTGPVQQAKLFV